MEGWYLGQDGDPEGLAGVGGPQVERQLGEELPGRLSLHPAGQLGSVPEARRKLLDLNTTTTTTHTKKENQEETHESGALLPVVDSHTLSPSSQSQCVLVCVCCFCVCV